MPTSLGLDDDLDDAYLIADLEGTFDVNLAGKDRTVHCRTVGELFALIEARLPENSSTGRCATAMTFYRLRRALQPRTSIPLRPDTPISALADITAKELQRIIEQECKLKAPQPHLTNPAIAGCIISFFISLSVALSPLIITSSTKYEFHSSLIPNIIAAASIFSSFLVYEILVKIVFKLAPRELSGNISTFGDLVRTVSLENIGRLADQGARLRVSDAWEVYKDILARHTELHRDLIEPDTLILDPQFMAA